MTPDMTYDQWILYGTTQGWCEIPVCDTHDGLKYTFEELEEFEASGDPCVAVLRLYPPTN